MSLFTGTITISIVVLALYFLIVLIFRIGWKRLISFEPNGIEQLDSMISVVVACKNEENKISTLIECLSQQTYQNFELILVNDHSTDSTCDLIKSKQANFPNLKLLDSIGFGKKNALKEGILIASSDFIITTDADCTASNRWLETILSFQNKFPSDLLICPVRISSDYSFFSRLQALEFVSLVGAAASSAGAGMPILCNGANLAFRKQIWLQCQSDLHYNEQSGDDMFLLESIKKHHGKIRFLKSDDAFVTTKAVENLSEFVKQRRRWAGKSKLYTDWQVIFTACVIFAISFLSLFLLTISFFGWRYLLLFLSLFSIKSIIDIRFLSLVYRFFRLENVWIFATLLALIYPFYIVFVALSSLIIKPLKWK
jgi:poly-beta-1,6-N-acetyl-D-glucosamine synthase